ncbi:hypothetical protein [Kutzneria sp. NPDC052558]|uniref:hypothetical protein n=1 Tax=Kutzneria sp. NPDC052558 TaxID=3364121 RepID=UPI0037C802ED
MTEVRQYVVGSRFARTGLTCDAEVAEQIGRLAAPYLEVTPETVTASGEVPVEYAVEGWLRDQVAAGQPVP